MLTFLCWESTRQLLLLYTTDEIHSVKCLAIDETPVLIAQSLRKLQIEIDSIIILGNVKNAYLYSQLTVKGRSFVNSKEFRLRFLRHELFDIKKSAIRMLKWLELTYNLFGYIALERPICISTDFTLHEQKAFRKGYVQLLPFRASGTGRQIICVFPYNDEAILKMLMYTFWVIGNDIDTQRKGVVIIVMFDSSFHQIHHLKGAGAARPSDHWLFSVRISAMHICTPDTPFFRLRRRFLIMAMGSHIRSRLKLHIGTSVELRYILQVFGIPIECIPITYTGKIKLAYIRQWLRIRNMIEDQENLIATNSNTNNIIVEAPYLNDVLFKSGVSFTSHPGNITLHNLIESKVKQLHKHNNNNNNKPQLQVVIKELKKALVLEIMDEIEHIHGGRFVYWHQSNNMSDCWWVLLHTNGNINDQKLIFNKIEFLFRKVYTKKQKLVKSKHNINMAITDENNIKKNNEKTKIQGNNNNDSLIIIDTPIVPIITTTTTTTTSSSASTTVKQNGGTYLFHSLDGKNNNMRGLLSLQRHDSISSSNSSTSNSSNGKNDNNSTTSSECFGMKFVPC
jgi:hypothetical protein